MCWLKSSIYGLNNLLDLGILESMKPMVLEDHYVYNKRTTGGIMFLTLYIDDALLGRNNLEMIKATKKCLFSIF